MNTCFGGTHQKRPFETTRFPGEIIIIIIIIKQYFSVEKCALSEATTCLLTQINTLEKVCLTNFCRKEVAFLIFETL